MDEVEVGFFGVFLALFSIVCYFVRNRSPRGSAGDRLPPPPSIIVTTPQTSQTRHTARAVRPEVPSSSSSPPPPVTDTKDGSSASMANKFRVSVNPFTPTGIEILKKRLGRKKELFPDIVCIGRTVAAGLEDGGGGGGGEHVGQCTPPDNKSPVPVDSTSVIRRLMDNGRVTNVSIRELQTSRFNEEFRIDEYIATGSFGTIYKCTNLFDGIQYAVKRIRRTPHKSPEYVVRKEVYANSVFGRHQNLVSYFTAWYERGDIYIQTEFCHGGTLERMVHDTDHVFCDDGLRRLLWHVCNGLAHIHSKKLAHLDIKAANILICRTNGALMFGEDLDEDHRVIDKDIVYKIGDFGHTICVEDVRNIEEGDSRYLPKELLRDDYSQLQKVDVFSTALTVYEAATQKRLPNNGPEWHRLRNGEFSFPQTQFISTSLEKLLKKMVDLDPTNRPSASKVVNLLLDRGMAAIKDQDEIEALKFSAQILTPWLFRQM